MADPITPAVSDRICKHMNEDHADAVLLYARVFGNCPDADAARLEAIAPQGMTLTATVGAGTQSLQVNFERELTDSEDAHQTLIAMVKTARSKLNS